MSGNETAGGRGSLVLEKGGKVESSKESDVHGLNLSQKTRDVLKAYGTQNALPMCRAHCSRAEPEG